MIPIMSELFHLSSIELCGIQRNIQQHSEMWWDIQGILLFRTWCISMPTNEAITKYQGYVADLSFYQEFIKEYGRDLSSSIN